MTPSGHFETISGPSRAFSRVGALLGLCLLLLPGQSLAEGKTLLRSPDREKSDWALCEAATLHTEKMRATPRALLHSIALAESGRYDAKSRKVRAWPWTINAQGRSYYFDSKRKAIAKAEELFNAGIRSFDVGCMQINMRYHPKAFASLEEAFDPMTNVAYGAEFLKQLHKQKGSWPVAVGQYHSETTFLRNRYFGRVIRIWEDERERFTQLARFEKRQEKLRLAGLRVTHGDEIVYKAPPALPPAPMVLGGSVKLATAAATASVGLRLSIPEAEFALADASAPREKPRVLDPTQIPDMPVLAGERPTLLADAGI